MTVLGGSIWSHSGSCSVCRNWLQHWLCNGRGRNGGGLLNCRHGKRLRNGWCDHDLLRHEWNNWLWRRSRWSWGRRCLLLLDGLDATLCFCRWLLLISEHHQHNRGKGSKQTSHDQHVSPRVHEAAAWCLCGRNLQCRYHSRGGGGSGG